MLTQAQPHREFREPTKDELALRRWLGLILSAGWMVPQTSGAKTPVVKLVVKLFNYAEISPQVLVGAEREAVSVYREAGILLSWVECGLSERDTEKFLAGEQVNDPFGLFVNIIAQPMAAGLPRPGKFATSFERHAVVFYHLVDGAAEDGRFSKALILGCVMAHELGHLVLGFPVVLPAAEGVVPEQGPKPPLVRLYYPSAWPGDQATPSITVRTYSLNLANAPTEDLVQANYATGQIFKQAGIEIRCLSCPLSLQKARTNRACAEATGRYDYRTAAPPRLRLPSPRSALRSRKWAGSEKSRLCS